MFKFAIMFVFGLVLALGIYVRHGPLTTFGIAGVVSAWILVPYEVPG